MMKTYALRILRVLAGLFLYALGSYMTIQANVGLGAWEAFGVGVSARTGLSYGDVIVLSGVGILCVDLLLGEKLGVATVLNTLLIGKFVDLLRALGLIPALHSVVPGILLLVMGQVVMCLGICCYIGAGLGAGPRDALMVALGKRLHRLPIGLIRGMVEGGALLTGWLLGAKVGIGTVLSIFGTSLIMQATFAVLRFNVKGVVHEDLLQTFHIVRKKVQPEP